MDRVNIFSSDARAASFDDFTQGEAVFCFRPLHPDGPRALIDGKAWAFVDWVMPDLSGLEMVRRLRTDPRTSDAHITMVLEEDDIDDRRRALKAGADDYAVGPLDRQTMLDRVLARFAQGGASSPVPVVQRGDLTINIAGEQARWQDQLIALRPNEFRVLRFLAENANRVFSRQELVDALGKEGDPEYLRTVDVWIKRLRQGLRGAGAGDILRTVHGRGYVLDLA
ncbi:response regulator transcription factor [Aurantiacibacter gangjinensis]|uniref:PhoB family transcriptional regulator n=1 Tax=Aurantiacibacter gangjinensis TaxID=502682 RepID=A0A0G9MMJ5_9SPHN|nr:response regulator transcription factor [Aurantiacibacter gangjinensis]APE27860.1 Phosphate regulon transcriptional regulatory protein PhoB (SphR) [Aurantiacibacter gangjinensis]KLE31834.1 PhoB family transcriptional regulator [Aurantiacibacter gangjinensis]